MPTPTNPFVTAIENNIYSIRDTIGEMTGLGDYVGIKIIDATGALADDPLSLETYRPDLSDFGFSDSLEADLCGFVAGQCIGARLGGLFKLDQPAESCQNPCSCSIGGHPCYCCPCP